MMTVVLTLVQILAMTMFGEAHLIHDKDAALAVGHVFINRLESAWFGNTPLEVTPGFNAFATVCIWDVPKEYFEWAQEVIDNPDFTGGCFFIMSHQDGFTVAGKNVLYVWAAAEWKSTVRVIDGKVYRLYAFKKYPSIDNYPYGLSVLANVWHFPWAERLLEQYNEYPQEFEVGH